MRAILITSILMFCSMTVLAGDFAVYEANYPDVRDYNVNIDEAVLTIDPHGAFVEMDLEVVVSYDFESWFFKNYDELEFSWDFQLPDQVTVNDFWLWIGDSILQVDVLDRWTAELLFSEVSSPVRNPALLTQSFPDREGLVNYNIRVYPVERNIQRRFKVQYLIPARPTDETLRVWLPTSPLTSRRTPGASELQVRFKGENAPTLLGADIVSEQFQDGDWHYTIALDYDQFVELVYETPVQNNFFFSTYEDNGESFYQLAVYPPQVEEIHTPRNFLVLVDHNRFNTDAIDGELVLLLLKETISQALSDEDSLNIMVAYDEIVAGAPGSVPFSEQNVDLLFNNILRRSFPSYSSFQIILAAAADFLQNTARKTDIMLLTNTDEIDVRLNPDLFADQIIAMFPAGTTVHIVDMDNKSPLLYNRTASQYETQLQSFYGRLTRKTGGNLFFLRYHAIKNILAALFYEKISHFQEIEVQTRFASGYAYGKHLIALHEGYYPLQFPVMQVGRFRGQLPLDISVIGKVRLEKAIDEFTINESDIVPGDAKLATAWYGDHIHELLKGQQTTPTILDIMDLSLEEKILTPYTGFLVFRPDENTGFDPADTPMTDPEFRDDVTAIDNSAEESDSTKTEITIAAFPNPFNLQVTIEINMPENTEIGLAIYNALGQKVREFSNNPVGDRMTFTWDSTTDYGQTVATGLYFAVLTAPQFTKTVKLMLLK